MYTSFKPIVEQELKTIEEAGLHKEERVISSRQGRTVRVGEKELLNFCANNYLGMAGSDEMVQAAKEALDKYGYGLSSVRFICGTQNVHKELEKKTAEFVGMEDAILYTSCMMANMGFFAAFLGEGDVIISDALNHASLIDGIRLCKAERAIFRHMDMGDLEAKLKEQQQKRMRCIVTDGVFSMDGDVASLKGICDLAEKYDALVVVDDSHATGFMGERGRGTHEHCGVLGRVDVITSTYGKALGGATGGFVAGPKELIALLRERSRTYLFSNSLPPAVAGASLFAIQYIENHPELREKLWENTKYFREQMQKAGFTVPESVHPIVPVMLGDAKKAKDMATAMLAEGIYVIAFSYPVVPESAARIRVQISSNHTREDLDKAVDAFVKTRG
ncbi:MAG: glycine C-acetyltransferase [Candidatus Wildermuthbacteria bacterium RIFCSPLOWO2_02_FULL_47_9c]|uniref:2-amino-3-ketobutyrate coenzyme A ligase n=2 Tax=Parcubacteria group TaxID=1794811 RepID=A0A837ILQ7_9BACT|nr:MAG: 2-amino-3-ketobutyrate coenzyme A ligase [Candidatus Yanofskybacteria bacterium GW2011_GWC1_48_11]KKW03997.1 MAG: 2-amino-3-ketobutyrate coenzyme A ligase [Parcubacteria group bacterium GW2011_GWB1_49_12]KKW08901.1 MAG: 2-amino-3-ketobutyrate coenzyme A ligase [Parcubacteria group bacterium GW2011_GWA1_49_26]OHA61819.1 MAG: glycine C-acetyltransferase [Candidatus Wildermuthbacteria bacterium GWA1_49_26]OHA65329.1 MAG: glycine C-acetyltransferase [Candidatus Wildermuthbacteria bacterium 